VYVVGDGAPQMEVVMLMPKPKNVISIVQKKYMDVR